MSALFSSTTSSAQLRQQLQTLLKVYGSALEQIKGGLERYMQETPRSLAEAVDRQKQRMDKTSSTELPSEPSTPAFKV